MYFKYNLNIRGTTYLEKYRIFHQISTARSEAARFDLSKARMDSIVKRREFIS